MLTATLNPLILDRSSYFKSDRYGSGAWEKVVLWVVNPSDLPPMPLILYIPTPKMTSGSWRTMRIHSACPTIVSLVGVQRSCSARFDSTATLGDVQEWALGEFEKGESVE